MAQAIPQTGNVSEPLLTMHRVTGGDPLLFEARENVLGEYQQLLNAGDITDGITQNFRKGWMSVAKLPVRGENIFPTCLKEKGVSPCDPMHG